MEGILSNIDNLTKIQDSKSTNYDKIRILAQSIIKNKENNKK
jgi:hypothetical protein